MTYNQAYQTPDNNNLFLDILQSQSPIVDVRVQGVPETGFHWSYDAQGNPQYRSRFAPLAGLLTSDFIDLNDASFTPVAWNVVRGAVLSGLSDNLTDAGLPASQVAALVGAVNAVAPTTVSGVAHYLQTLDPDIGGFAPSTISDIADIERMKSATTKTFELGYKGVLNNRFQFSADLYSTKKNNFVGPLTVESPNVFLDPTSLSLSIGPDIGSTYAGLDAATRAALDSFDQPSLGGNNNGTPVDELILMFTAGAAGIPFGTVSPLEALNPGDILVTYRNFGDISFYGADLAFDIHLNRNFDFGGTYSYVSKNFFAKSSTQVHDIFLNAPMHKFGIRARYVNQKAGLNVQSRLRWVDGFDMDSPFIGKTVESFMVVDLNIGWKFAYSTTLNLTIQNILDNEHNEFVGAPKIGRLAIARLTQKF